MNIVSQPEAPTASPAIQEQSLSAFFSVDIMIDADDGRSVLAIATETNFGDLRETGHGHARRVLAEVRAKLDEAERLINEHEAATTLAAMLAENGLTLIEAPVDKLAEINSQLAAGLRCWGLKGADGRMYAVVPQGQSPVEHVDAVSKLIGDLEAQAEAQA